jgi:hypothetical protein
MLTERIICHMRETFVKHPVSDAALPRFLCPLLLAVYGEEFTEDAVIQAIKRQDRKRAMNQTREVSTSVI